MFSKNDCVFVYQACVHSILLYGNVVWTTYTR